MVFFHHRVSFRGILKVLGLFFVELVCRNLRMHLLDWFKRLVEVIPSSKLNEMFKRLKSITYLKVFTRILIAIVNSNCTSTDSNVKSDSEIRWFEWHLRSILLDDHLSLKESTLWCTRIYLFWFCDQN